MSQTPSPPAQISASPAQISSAWVFFGLLYACAIGNGILHDPQPLLAVIRAEFGISTSQVSLLTTIPLLALGLCPLFYGVLMAYISTRTIMAASIILLATTSIFIFFTSSFATVLAVRTLQSLIFPALFTAIMTSIALKYKGADLQHAMSMYIGVAIFGTMVFRIFAGYLSSVFDWRIALTCIAMAILPALFIVPRLSAEPPNQQRFELSALISICKTPNVGRLLIMEWCTYFVFMGVATCLPFRLATIAPTMNEFGVGLMYMGYIAGIMLAVWSKQVIHFFGNEIRSLRVGFLISLLSLPVFLIPHVGAIFLAMWIICTGQFLEHTINPGVINRLVTHHQSMVNGLYLSVYYTGGAFGSYFPPLIQSYFGWEWAIALMTVILLIGFNLSRRVNLDVLQNSPPQIQS